MTDRGVFIVLEGGDGCGKTTIATRLHDFLQGMGGEVAQVEDPGTTPLGQGCRRLVVDANIACEPIEQVMLYSAARHSLARHVNDLLLQNTIVIGTRWDLSTYVYQCHMGGVDSEFIEQCQPALEPDISIYLHLDHETKMARKASQRGATLKQDRFESRGEDWHKGISEGYQVWADSLHYETVDASQDVQIVSHKVLEVCQENERFNELLQGAFA